MVFVHRGFLISAFAKVSKDYSISWSHQILQKCWMTKHRRVQERSKRKRVRDLDIAVERHKVVSKLLVMLEVLKKEPEHVIPLRNLEQYRKQISLKKPHKVADFIRKSPKLFELYQDRRGVVWCGLTAQGQELVEEESRLLEEHIPKAIEYITRFLMMSIEKRLPVDKIAHFRRDLGLPYDFRSKMLHMFPEHFRVVVVDDVEHLELASWNPEWAITELEKKVLFSDESRASVPGVLSLPFPMKFPPNFKKVFRDGGNIENFQKRQYLSPYADAQELVPGSREFDKRAIAIIHEILSFTLEKRVVTDFLTHFRREFSMPQKLMRLLLKHYGIFYVSERGKRFSVFLTEAYNGYELIEKCPLVLWKEKVLRLTGYRGRRKQIGCVDDTSDEEGDSEDTMELMDEDETSYVDLDDSFSNMSELDIGFSGNNDFS